MQWPKSTTKIKLRGGTVATYNGIHAVTSKHAVRSKDSNTTWLLDEEGFARHDHSPSPNDYTGEDQ